MRSFHTRERFNTPSETLILPPNVLLLATHGSREVPAGMILSSVLRDPEFGEARQLDFSDFGTGLIQDYFDRASIVSPPKYGRIGGDANRKPSLKITGEDASMPKGKEAFRSTTMAGVLPVWEVMPTDFQRALWLDESHTPYYDKITASVMHRLQTVKEQLLIVDLHDTGDVRLEPDGSTIPSPTRLERYGRQTFFEAVISDHDGQTARPVVRTVFLEALLNAYRENNIPANTDEVRVNDPYKGGYVTEFTGLVLPKRLQQYGFSAKDTNRINAIQLEIPRHRFMPDEQYQIVDPKLVRNEAFVLHRILTEAGLSI